MKKLVSLLLALAMVLGMVPAVMADEAAASDLLTITEEEITLTYAACDEDYELTMELADQFMEQYPNITVEVLELDPSTYTEGLGNLASEQNLPDVFWMQQVTDAVANGWALRLDDYYAADPDAAEISASILKMAQVGGRRYSIPAKSRPMIAVVNKTIYDNYNVELPSPEWDWDEFITSIEAVAHPEEYYFGFGHNASVEYFMSRFGWDGNSYTFDDNWVMLEETFADLRARKVADNMTDVEKESILGDVSATADSRGRVAVNITSFVWGASVYVDGTKEAETGCEYLIYPVPSPVGTNPDDMWFSCISKGTKYPNEAWELAKWMTWGAEATMLRNQWFLDNEVLQNSLPMIDNEAVWADAKEKAPEKLKDYFEYVKPISPSIDTHAPNIIWCNVLYYFGGVPGKFASGESNPADMAASLRAEYNGYRDDWFIQTSEFGAVPEHLVIATATDLDVAE